MGRLFNQAERARGGLALGLALLLCPFSTKAQAQPELKGERAPSVWATVKNSEALRDPWSQELSPLIYEAKDPRQLQAGQWTVVWLDAFESIWIESQGGGVPVAKRYLGEQKATGWFQVPLEARSAGVWKLVNASPGRRAYAIGSADQKLSLALRKPMELQPDLAFDRATKALFEAVDRGGLAPANWLGQDPEIRSFFAARASLSGQFPRARAQVDQWLRFALSQRLLQLRPPSMTGWSKQVAKTRSGTQGTWRRVLRSGATKDYTRVRGPSTLWIEVEGPGVLELEARALAPADKALEISLGQGGARMASLALLPEPAKLPCDPQRPQTRCSVPVDRSTQMGRAQRLRIPVLGSHKREVRLDIHAGQGLVYFKHARLRPKLWADPLRQASLEACRGDASASGVRAGSPDPETQTVFSLLMAACDSDQALAAARVEAAMQRVCARPEGAWGCAVLVQSIAAADGIKEEARGQLLAQSCNALQRSGQQDAQAAAYQGIAKLLGSDRAQICAPSPNAPLTNLVLAQAVGAREPARVRDFFPALEARLQAKSPALERAERSRLLDVWRSASTWKALSPSAELQSQRWIVPQDGELQSAHHALGPSKSWSALAPAVQYSIQVPAMEPGELARVDLVWGSGAASTRVVIDDETQPLGPQQRRGAWLLAPGLHTLRVDGPAKEPVMATLATLQPSEHGLARRLELWPLLEKSEPVQFELPLNEKSSLVSVQLRLLQEDRQRTWPGPWDLWLCDDRGMRRKLEFDPQRLASDLALPLKGKGKLSQALSFVARVSPGATRLWIEGPSLWQGQYLARFRVRQARPQAESPSTASDKTLVPASSSKELRSAQEMVKGQQWGQLRDTLAQWSQAPVSGLVKERSARLGVLNAYQSYLEQGRRRYQLFDVESTPTLITLPLVDGKEASSPALAGQQMRSAAADFAAGTPAQQQSAVASAYRFSAAHAADKDTSAGPGLWPLAYGLMHVDPHPVRNPRLNALRGVSARRTTWNPISFASQSSGFEHTESRGIDWAQKDPLGTAIESKPGAIRLTPKASKTLRLELTGAGQLRLSSFCRSGKEKRANLAFELDDESTQTLLFPTQAPKTQQWSLQAGAHVITVAERAGLDCALYLESRLDAQSLWTVVQAPLRQRWFAAGPKGLLAFHVQGPGVLRIDTRALGQGSSNAQAKAGGLRVTLQGKTRTLEKELSLSTQLDPDLRLERDPSMQVHEAQQDLLLLPEDELYLVAFDAPTQEALVRAHARVPKEAKAAPDVPRNWASLLKARLQVPSNPVSTQISLGQAPSPGLRRTISRPKDRYGSWELAMRSGIDRETQYETVQSRIVSGLSGTWRRELLQGKMWMRARLSGQSQGLATPMFAGLLEVSGQSKMLPLRYRVGGLIAAQPMKGASPSSGQVWGQLEGSLRRAYQSSKAWDLRPSLRFDVRATGQEARELGLGPLAEELNSTIYRKYAVDHPFALKPKLAWTWRDFRNARIEAAVDGWLNSEVTSFDRARAWLRFAGILTQHARRPSWWIYEFRYRWTRAFVDADRRQGFTRHGLSARVQWAWQWSHNRRLELSLADRVLFSGQGYLGNEIRLGLGLRFDPLDAFRHYAPRERLFMGEIRRRDWSLEELR